VDVETRDKGLEQNNGPGWPWEGGGHVVGLAVATDDGEAWYFPVRHEVGGGNLNPSAVFAWARDELGRDSQPKVGANLLYDIGWLGTEGVLVRGQLHDVQFAEPLLNEHANSYALGTLAQQYQLTSHGKGEEENALYQWASQAYGGSPTRKAQAGNIYRCPAALVGPYALQDVRLPFSIARLQIPQLQRQGLFDLYRMECGLTDVLYQMRKQGCRVNHQAVERTVDEYQQRADALLAELGDGADIGSPLWLQRAFDREGIAYPRTKLGNPSFTAKFLETCPGRLPELIREYRQIEKVRGTFLQGYILDKHRNGVIHAEFHPLRTDENGTVSGRLSSSNPNLQNLPARNADHKRVCRGAFLPWEGHYLFTPDYSQIEYRLMVHAAVGPGAEEARARYRADPRTDYHTYVQDLIRLEFGRALDRKPIKNINFGMIFGMGEATLQGILNMDDEEAHKFFQAYYAGVPFARKTLDAFSGMASRDGFIRTVLGRRARFPHWEGRKWEQGRTTLLTKEEAVQRYGANAIRRARVHKALNAYTQGSGGDIIKKAMLDCYTQLGAAPLITVHDELVFSLPIGAEGARMEKDITEVMTNVVQLSVPLLVSEERGLDWGHVSKNSRPGWA